MRTGEEYRPVPRRTGPAHTGHATEAMPPPRPRPERGRGRSMTPLVPQVSEPKLGGGHDHDTAGDHGRQGDRQVGIGPGVGKETPVLSQVVGCNSRARGQNEKREKEHALRRTQPEVHHMARHGSGEYPAVRPESRRLVKIPSAAYCVRRLTGIGAVAQFGRAPESHSGGRGFDPHPLHHLFASGEKVPRRSSAQRNEAGPPRGARRFPAPRLAATAVRC